MLFNVGNRIYLYTHWCTQVSQCFAITKTATLNICISLFARLFWFSAPNLLTLISTRKGIGELLNTECKRRINRFRMRIWWFSWTKRMHFSQGLCVVFCNSKADPLLISSLSPGLVDFWVCQINGPSHSHTHRWGWCHLAAWPASTRAVIYSLLVSPASHTGEVWLTWARSTPAMLPGAPRRHLWSLESYTSQWGEPQAMGNEGGAVLKDVGRVIAAGGSRETLGEPQHPAGTSSLRPMWLQAQLDASIIGPGLVQALGCCWAFPAIPAEEVNKHHP